MVVMGGATAVSIVMDDKGVAIRFHAADTVCLDIDILIADSK
jgi:hypothetical protein